MKVNYVSGFCIALVLLTVAALPAVAPSAKLPKGFVYLDDVIPGIELEIRYYGSNNFIGRRIDGYHLPRCILTRKAAEALKKVQSDLHRFRLSLKVFDAYRPQRAVNHFVRWARDKSDTLMKSGYYPEVAKRNLFRDGYIASKSGHSRGSTLDLTIVAVEAHGKTKELDMGTPFDMFSERSRAEYPLLSGTQRANRMLLQTLMVKHGFRPYPKEWWHFTLRNEPFPETYFDFPVE